MKFETVKLGDFVTITMGQSPKSEFYNTNGDGMPFLQGNRTFGLKYPNFDTYTTKVTKEAKAGDVIMSVRAPVGDLNITPINMCLGRGVCSLRANNNNQDFLFYLMKYYMPLLLNKESGTVFGSVNKNDINNLEINLPPLETQKKIASILSALDDKIELNNKINENLEMQAQAIFKSWFVDFEPFGGVMPEDWKIKDIYSIANIIYGAPFKSKLFNTEKDGKPIVRIRDLKSNELTTFTTEIHPKGYLIQNGDIVVGMDGEFKPYIWGNNEAWLNQRVCVFDNIRENGKFFLYLTIKPLLNIVEQTEVATTVIHIGKSDFDSFEINLPNENILDKFDTITMPIYKLIVKNKLENKRLAELRDTLLPKLMNGEIDVDDVQVKE